MMLRAFGANDLKGVRRDPALYYMLLVPPLMIPAARLLLPSATAYLARNFGFDLLPYYPMLLSFFFVLQIPMLFGVLVGLLVLDEKDDDTLSVLRVTPISMRGYALYRGAAAVLLSALYVSIALSLTGLLPSSLVSAMVSVALLSGTTAPVFALLLATLARNKVEGLALMKALSVLMLGPLAAYFVGPGWQLLFGVLPTYWPAKAFWVAAEGGGLLALRPRGSGLQPRANGPASEAFPREGALGGLPCRKAKRWQGAKPNRRPYAAPSRDASYGPQEGAR